jgi:hypothetical protein
LVASLVVREAGNKIEAIRLRATLLRVSKGRVVAHTGGRAALELAERPSTVDRRFVPG